MKSHEPESTFEVANPEDRAAEIFMRRRFGAWTADLEAELQALLQTDLALADAFRRVEQSWAAAGDHAVSAEFMALRESAIYRARRAAGRRWLTVVARRWSVARIVTAVAASVIVALVALQFAPFGLWPGEYGTNIGERRVVELDDHSQIILDAATHLKVQFTKDARTVQLIQGQAQFSVAKDPVRPFKVIAGGRTVVAVGTVFTVEYVEREVRVTMLEGKVAILPLQPPNNLAALGSESRQQANSNPTELTAGQAIRVRQDGRVTLTPVADVEAATAWRDGKIILHKEPLSEAVRRLNRYSRVQVEIADPALAEMQVSGVFETDDTQTFVEAIQSYIPVTADYSTSGVIRLQTSTIQPTEK